MSLDIAPHAITATDIADLDIPSNLETAEVPPIEQTIGRRYGDASFFNRTNKLYNSAIVTYERKRLSDALPTKAYGTMRFFMNYVLPTRYMRFVSIRFLITLLMWLPVLNKLPVRPYIPLLSLEQRKWNAILRMRKLIFREAKVIASFHLGGGVGKTTIGLLKALAIKRTLPSVNVSILDCDDGTLIQRVDRTAVPSMLDYLDNLDHINTHADQQRYCTRTEYGLKVMAMRRDNQLDDVKIINHDEIKNVIRKASRLEDIIVCDLGPNKSETTRGVLDMTDQIQIVTTPADDRLDQAVATFSWLLENNYGHLAMNAIIVVNACTSQKDVDKVTERFMAKHAYYMDNVQITSVRHNKKLKAGAKVVQSMLSRREEVHLLEDTAAMLENLAESRVDAKTSQLTHIEILNIGQENG